MIGSVLVLLRNHAQALVLEDFKLVADGFGHLPGFCAMQ